MKAAIITLNGANNYGNVLQNYAVQEVLNAVGCETQTIKNTTLYGHYIERQKEFKLSPKYIQKYVKGQLKYKYGIKNSYRGLINQYLGQKKLSENIYNAKKLRQDNFLDFCEKYINMSEVKIDINNQSDKGLQDYDVYICGSDQVWNPNFPETSSINFLQFAPENRRIALSPSFGVSEIPDYIKDEYIKYLSEIPHLSVREDSGREIIKSLIGKDVDVLIDPTLILDSNKWQEIEEKPDNIKENEKYIFTYFLGDETKEYKKYIDTLAKNIGLRVINAYDINEISSYSLSPQNFIYLINHAQLVCTDSFHGTVFSINFKTNFISFPRVEDGYSVGSRVNTVLSKFKLEDRAFGKVKDSSIFGADFKGIDTILDSERQQAYNYLRSAISTIEPRQAEITSTKKALGDNGCCGCGACSNICPTDAITLEYDQEGFKYPVVDTTKCIRCNKCFSVCPVDNKSDTTPEKEQAFAAYSNDTDTRKSSSSGGVFYELASFIIEQGGIVFGAGFDDNFNVVHKCVSTTEELKKLKGSKYVQSDINSTYREAKTALDEKKLVYFSGTPCQIEGLKRFLGDKCYPNLITQNIVCHGVPSPKMWTDYINCNKFQNIKSINFRNKKYGWHYFSLNVDNKKPYTKRLDEDIWLKAFISNEILRPICYDCPFKNDYTYADFTLADCWGLTNELKTIKDDDKGLSLVFLKSENAQIIWSKLVQDKKLTVEEVDLKKAKDSQSPTYKSANMNAKRQIIFDTYNKYGIEEVANSICKDKPLSLLKKKIIFIKTKVYMLIKQ